MTLRLIDAMCHRHRSWTVQNRMWRDSFTCNEGCRTVTGVLLLPHLDPTRQLAIHEAGHAVVFLALGEHIVEAAVNLTPDSATQSPGGVRTVSTRVDGRGVVAGASAVARWANPTTDADIVDIANGARHDFRNAWSSRISVDHVAELLREADVLVAEHWPAIERVADALLAAGWLSGDEVAAIAGITCNA